MDRATGFGLEADRRPTLSASDPVAGDGSRRLTVRLQEAAIRRSIGSSRFQYLSTQVLGILDR